MVWLIAVAAALISIGAGVVGMFTHNTPLFIGGWIASFVSILVLMGLLWGMLMSARRERIRRDTEALSEPWDDD